jgi:uncharacterized protein (AIM24 family)
MTGTADGVQYRIAYRDSNSLLSLRLQGGTEIKAKPGSMVAMDGSVQIKGKMKFSFKKLIKGGDVRFLIRYSPNSLSQAPFLRAYRYPSLCSQALVKSSSRLRRGATLFPSCLTGTQHGARVSMRS